MRKILLVLIILLPLLFTLNRVSAQESQAVSPDLYQTIQQKLVLDEALGGKDPSQLTQEQINNALEKALDSGSVPSIGEIRKENDQYLAVTGLTGTAIGTVPKGAYELMVKPIDEIKIKLPAQIYLAKSLQENELLVGLEQAKGKGSIVYGEKSTNSLINKTASISSIINNIQVWFKKLFARFIETSDIKPVDSTSGNKNEVKVPLAVKLYQDGNGNGQFDDNEKPVQWANFKLTLQKVSTEQTLSLKQGNNNVQFKILPLNAQTAFDLLVEAVSGGAGEATLTYIDKGKTTSVTLKGTEYTGTNFELKAKSKYNLVVPKDVDLTLIYKQE